MNRQAVMYDYKNKDLESEAGLLSDAELVQRIAIRNEAAFQELYQRFSSPLFTYLVRLIMDVESAEDILQDVFFSVWKDAARFRGHASVKTWLFRITHYQAISWLRKHHRETTFEDNDTLTAADDPEEAVLTRYTEDALRFALQKLSPEHRAVLELTFYQGFSYAQIAEILQCPLGTVKSRMSYSRKRMVQLLHDFMSTG